MIYIVRHGQTDWKKMNMLQGRIDVELNQTGIDQAKAAAESLKDIKFDVCFCSPMKRTKQTCDIVYKGKVNFDHRVIERDFGEYEGKKESEVNWHDFWDCTKNLTVKKAESLLDVEKRVFNFLNEIAKNYKGKNILVVTHGGVGMFVKTYFNGKPKSNNYLEYLVKTGEVMQFGFKQVEF